MLNTGEVKSLYEIVDHYHKEILSHFGLTRSDDPEDDIEVRDFVNDPQYTENKELGSQYGQIQYYFSVHGFYMRLSVYDNCINFRYTGNEYLEDMEYRYKHNGTPENAIHVSRIGLELFSRHWKKYVEFKSLDLRSKETFQIVEREMSINDIISE